MLFKVVSTYQILHEKIFVGELVDEVRTFFAQETKDNELMKHLLLKSNSEKTKLYTTSFVLNK